MIKFGENLKKLRQWYGFTQAKLGKLINVSDTTIRSWEIYGIEPNLTNLAKLADILKVTVGQLIGTEYLDIV